MKLMYSCEICKRIYKTEKAALFCESHGTPEYKFEIGETVWFKDRNGTWNHITITNRKVGADLFFSDILKGWEPDRIDEGIEKAKKCKIEAHSKSYYFGGMSFYCFGKEYYEWITEEALESEKEHENSSV